jgi:hypothetical protein
MFLSLCSSRRSRILFSGSGPGGSNVVKLVMWAVTSRAVVTANPPLPVLDDLVAFAFAMFADGDE